MNFMSAMGMLNGLGGMGGGGGGGMLSGAGASGLQKVAGAFSNAANQYLGYNQQPGLQQVAKQQKQQQLLDPQLQQLIQQWQPMDTAAPNMVGTTSMRY